MEQQTALTNLQSELLKLYSNSVSEQQLFKIKLLLARYFAEKATDAMDKISEIPELSELDSNRFHHATIRLLELAKKSIASSDERRWSREELKHEFE